MKSHRMIGTSQTIHRERAYINTFLHFLDSGNIVKSHAGTLQYIILDPIQNVRDLDQENHWFPPIPLINSF